MAIAFGSIGGTTLGTSVAYPTGISAGDLLLLVVCAKVQTAVVSTPSGWTLLSNAQAEGGFGSETTNSGTVDVSIFLKEATGSESGSQTISVSGANHFQAFMARYTKTGAAWSYAAASAPRNSGGASYSAVGNVDPGIQAGDMVVVAAGINTDNSPSWGSESLTATGITTGTVTQRRYAQTTSGSDSGLVLTDFTIASGSSSGVPTFAMTGSVLFGAEGAGAAVIMRLRESGGSAPRTPYYQLLLPAERL